MITFKQFLTEEKYVSQSKRDIDDAEEVFHGWMDHSGYSAGMDEHGNYRGKGDFRSHFDELSKPHSTKRISIDKLLVHNDWGRRVKGSNLKKPIIVVSHPEKEGHFVVLDGQHRVITNREENQQHIEASVLNLSPWKKHGKKWAIS